MSNPCHEHEMEIAAAAGGALEAHVERHLQGCPGCRALRQETSALAGASRIEPGAFPGLGAIARDAVREARGRRPALWAVPLVSASASAAALIIYFGIFHAPAGEQATGTSGGSAVTVTEAPQVALPDSLRAVSDLLLEHSEQESRQ